MDNLPRYFVLESLSNNKYLRYVHEDVPLHGHLEFSGEKATSPYAKYELEPADENRSGNSVLFNIRCCHNNKYWKRSSESTWWITATADEPVEDPFKWSCTLFEASLESPYYDNPKLRLRHVQHGRNTPVSIGIGSNPKYLSCLNVEPNGPFLQSDHSNFVFSIIDFDSFVVLPKTVLFKGDNGQYVSHYGTIVAVDGWDSLSAFLLCEVFYTRDGSVRIMSEVKNKFWRATPDNILADSADENDAYTLFSLRKGPGENEVALRSKGVGYFCHTRVDHKLVPNGSEMRKETIMTVEEPVGWRSIYNVHFRLKDARIYNRSDVLLVSKRLSNPLDVDKVTNVKETITKETTRTWKSSVSLKLSTPTTIETKIPLIVDGEVGLWDAYKGPYEWGTDVKGSQTMGVSDDITIPANSTVMLHVIATQGMCDVPFSYLQRDRLYNGTSASNKMDDGVYTGINYYNLTTKVVQIW